MVGWGAGHHQHLALALIRSRGEVHLWDFSLTLCWYQHRPSDCSGEAEGLGLLDRELGWELECWWGGC